ncbi:hypothetical protein SAMN06298216_1753 [Spirosomataceae bacterium TFI 002]|nr:hypothetical protein SAMN06298216_1753 [Spirosomataceae bacterium TFI 002]
MSKRKSNPKKTNQATQPTQVESVPVQELQPLESKWVILLLAAFVFVFYAKVWGNELVWDDDPYITLNDAVINFNLNELLTGFHVGNYHPLTMLSLAIEYLIVGESPWLYHLNNLLFHIANSWLVFQLFTRLKISFWISFVTAILFAIHPLHVESVAWAAERKDVLYTFFLLASFLFYLRYNESKSKMLYAVSLLLFLASCLSKGMAVVLPALLVITDWWFLGKKFSVKNLLDKVPFFAITLFFAWLATTAQKDAGADATSVISAAYSGGERVQIVSYSFLFYWIKSLIPLDLLPFYPYPARVNGFIPTIFTASLFGLLIFLGTTFWLGLKNKKIWWAVAFFIIAISTVLQILPVGSAIVADRYYYLSSIGPLFLITYAIFHFIKKTKSAVIISGIMILLFSIKTFFQVGHWENLRTLFEPAEEKYPEDAMVLSNLGWHYLGEEDFQRAKTYLIRSDNNGFKNADVCRTIGSMFIDEGAYNEALPYIQRAYEYKPEKPRTDWLMALAYSKQNSFLEALPYAKKAFEAEPTNADFKTTYASMESEAGDPLKARELYSQLLLENPESNDFELNISYTYRKEGNFTKEIELLTALINKSPSYLPAYRNIGITLDELGRSNETIEYWKKAAEFDLSGDYEYNIGINYVNRGLIQEAIPYYQSAAKKGKKEAVDILKNNGIEF